MGRLVMIIDDSRTVQKILEVALKREGIETISYTSGVEVLQALKSPQHQVPDVIMMDIGLPQLDGYTLARLLKSKPAFDQTSIIMLSGRDGIIDHLKGRLAGARSYITKPFKTQEVVALVCSCFSSTSPDISRNSPEHISSYP